MDQEDIIATVLDFIEMEGTDDTAFNDVALKLFAYQFKNANTVTKKAKLDLSELETEFEQHRKTALKREQKVMRKLQDEINKNKQA